MKTLFLIRHAKSSWDDPAMADADRPLADRGKRDAPRMGKRLAQRDVEPDLIVSSPATRALATARIFAEQLGYKPKDVQVDRRLYPGQANELLRVIQRFDDELDRVMLFGHNPALLDLAHYLSTTITRMPTSAVAELVFDAKSWSKVDRNTLSRVTLDYPKKSRG